MLGIVPVDMLLSGALAFTAWGLTMLVVLLVARHKDD